VRGGCAFDDRDRFVGAAAQAELPGNDLSGVDGTRRNRIEPQKPVVAGTRPGQLRSKDHLYAWPFEAAIPSALQR
jgi:hypothetical protein